MPCIDKYYDRVKPVCRGHQYCNEMSRTPPAKCRGGPMRSIAITLRPHCMFYRPHEQCIQLEEFFQDVSQELIAVSEASVLSVLPRRWWLIASSYHAAWMFV